MPNATRWGTIDEIRFINNMGEDRQLSLVKIFELLVNYIDMIDKREWGSMNVEEIRRAAEHRITQVRLGHSQYYESAIA